MTGLATLLGPAALALSGCGMGAHENEKSFANTKGYVSPDAAESAEEYERKLNPKGRVP